MSDFSTEELKLALGYHMARLILETDAVITTSETDFLERLFPRSAVQKAGFVGADGGFTERHRDGVREALRVLPGAMSEDEKFAFLKVMLDATLADGTFDPEEGGVFTQAADMLGIEGDRLDAMLESMEDVGSLDLPEPEAE